MKTKYAIPPTLQPVKSGDDEQEVVVTFTGVARMTMSQALDLIKAQVRRSSRRTMDIGTLVELNVDRVIVDGVTTFNSGRIMEK